MERQVWIDVSALEWQGEARSLLPDVVAAGPAATVNTHR